MTIDVKGLPADILESTRAVLWSREVRNGQPTKVPYQARRPLDRASVTDSTTWAPFADALAAHADGKADGVGIVLGEGLIGIDLDHCVDEQGRIAPWARVIVEQVDSYTEGSPSGTGLHLLARGVLPSGGRKKGPIEMYGAARYFTITGQRLPGTRATIEHRTAELAAVHAQVFGSSARPSAPKAAAPKPPTSVDLDEAALLERARSASNGAKFSRLWGGDTADYPSRSEADLALCLHLAFWTGKDSLRMDRLFRQSGLMREKWDSRHGDRTYGDMTIEKAISVCGETYSGTRPKGSSPSTPSSPQNIRGRCESSVDPSEAVSVASDESRPQGRHVHLTPACDIPIKPVKWLWEGRCPLGTLGLLGGREGIGKSTVAYGIAADVTRGRLPGACFGTPRAVVVAATEDSWEHTIVPRLMAADADLSRVYQCEVSEAGLDASLVLPKDLPALQSQVATVDAAMILLDPLMSRLDAGLDSHKDAEVRRALEPVTALAHSTGVFVLGLIHVNKSASNDALNMLMGSRAFAAVARSVLFVMLDPNNEHTRLLGLAKNNLGRLDVPVRQFRIVGACVGQTVEGDVWSSKVEWLGDTTQSIRDAIESGYEDPDDRTAKMEAADWLRDFLAARGGRCEATAAKKAGKEAGHAERTLGRARKALGVKVDSGGFPRTSTWVLSQATVRPSQNTGTTGTTGTTERVPLGETCLLSSTTTTPQSGQSCQSGHV